MQSYPMALWILEQTPDPGRVNGSPSEQFWTQDQELG